MASSTDTNITPAAAPAGSVASLVAAKLGTSKGGKVKADETRITIFLSNAANVDLDTIADALGEGKMRLAQQFCELAIADALKAIKAAK